MSFPQWLCEKLVNDSVDWTNQEQIRPLDLRQIITLHDSSQIKVMIDSAWDGFVTIAVQWDTFWNKEIFDYPGDSVVDWPILIIRIDGVTKISIADFQPTATQRAVSDIETNEEEIGFRTRLMDVCGGKIDFHHTGDFRLALFTSTGEPRAIK